MIYSKYKDIRYAIGTGLLAGIIAWRVAISLDLAQFVRLPLFWLVVIIPVIWLTIIWGFRFLGIYFTFFDQFGRFVVIGFTNALVDYGYLNIMIFFSSLATGVWFSIFKTGSFIVANISSYILNKYWTFNSAKSASNEYIVFFIVSVIALFVNVSTASLVVNGIKPLSGFTTPQWANIGAMAGSAVALMINFLGYKILVFRKSLPPVGGH